MHSHASLSVPTALFTFFCVLTAGGNHQTTSRKCLVIEYKLYGGRDWGWDSVFPSVSPLPGTGHGTWYVLRTYLLNVYMPFLGFVFCCSLFSAPSPASTCSPNSELAKMKRIIETSLWSWKHLGFIHPPLWTISSERKHVVVILAGSLFTLCLITFTTGSSLPYWILHCILGRYLTVSLYIPVVNLTRLRTAIT